MRWRNTAHRAISPHALRVPPHTEDRSAFPDARRDSRRANEPSANRSRFPEGPAIREARADERRPRTARRRVSPMSSSPIIGECDPG